ncbi:MAG: hypothetical protein NUV53_01615 [Patescibacteria group bacterium]|nr:hypothetical protein [Patescibacteria group bacterium]
MKRLKGRNDVGDAGYPFEDLGSEEQKHLLMGERNPPLFDSLTWVLLGMVIFLSFLVWYGRDTGVPVQ